jgi:hypothetical protein
MQIRYKSLPFIKDHNENIITVNNLPEPKKNFRWTFIRKALIIEAVKKKICYRKKKYLKNILFLKKNLMPGKNTMEKGKKESCVCDI